MGEKFTGTEKVHKMLEVFIYDTMKIAERVVNEAINNETPEVSAVATKKRIQLYIDLSKDLNKEFPLRNFKDVIANQGYNEDFVRVFNKCVSEELKIYRGHPEWNWNQN